MDGRKEGKKERRKEGRRERKEGVYMHTFA
jgi:hypothetical protein